MAIRSSLTHITMVLVTCMVASHAALAVMQKPPEQYDYDSEVYTEHGEVMGCGLSYHAVWVSDDNTFIGLTGSTTFFASSDNAFAVVKAAAVNNVVQKPVAYAWVETKGHHRTTDFKAVVQSEDPMTFYGANYLDPMTVLLPIHMATNGFVLGMAFQGQSIDNVVAMPPADATITAKVQQCFHDLEPRLKALSGK